jgi:tetratricopeptide (TPR) repeat protein
MRNYVNYLCCGIIVNTQIFFNKTRDKSGISIAYNHIGEYYRKIKMTDSALYFFHQSLDARKGFSDQYYLSYTLNNLANAYLLKNDFKKAYHFILDSENEARRIGDSSVVLMQIYELYYRYYKKIRDFKKALFYKELAVEVNKKINSANNQKAALRQQAKLFYEKQKVLDDKENEKRIFLEKVGKQRQKVISIAILVGLLLVSVFSYYLLKRYRTTQKQKNIIETQKLEVELQKHLVEEKNQEITDSITYAKRIQGAILPSIRNIKSILPDSFILYKPKDIVAGDFYWLEIVGDTVLFAAADCTGHGVPGAMVSVVCNNGLKSSSSRA